MLVDPPNTILSQFSFLKILFTYLLLKFNRFLFYIFKRNHFLIDLMPVCLLLMKFWSFLSKWVYISNFLVVWYNFWRHAVTLYNTVAGWCQPQIQIQKRWIQKPNDESKLETTNPKAKRWIQIQKRWLWKPNVEFKSLISIRRFHFGFAVLNLDLSFLIWICRLAIGFTVFLIWIRRLAFGFVVSNLDPPFGF